MRDAALPLTSPTPILFAHSSNELGAGEAAQELLEAVAIEAPLERALA